MSTATPAYDGIKKKRVHVKGVLEVSNISGYITQLSYNKTN